MITPTPHPNLIPVLCENFEDISKLAQEMRLAASADPDIDVEYQKSETFEIAESRAKAKSDEGISVADRMLNRGILRFISYQRRLPVNVVFTLRKDENINEWNLSISHATVEGPVRVNDELASMIVEAFLEKDFQEVPPKAVWDTVRHFIKVVE
jgi:hypothetical protein